MNNNICQQLSQRLVDYADGELGAAEVVAVESHLADCEKCREELRLLEASLELARAVWNEPTDVSAVVASAKVRRVPVAIAAGLATCAAALAIAFGLGLFSSDEPRQHAERPSQVPPVEPGPVDEVPVMPRETEDEIDIERLIADEGRAAMLAASLELLATQPSLAEYHEQAERYLTETYPGTAAVESVLKQNVPLPIKEPQS